MTLQQLRYITAIAESGSINGAANLLQVSQSSLSNALSNLEREMKIVVFQRNNRGVSLTPEGEEFLGYARRAIDEFRALEVRYSGRARTRRRFAVAAQPSALASAAFASVAREFARDDFELIFNATSVDSALHCVETFKSEIATFVLTSANQATAARAFNEREVEFIELGPAPLCAYFSASHPLAGTTRVKIDQLAPYPRVLIQAALNRETIISAERSIEIGSSIFEIQAGDIDAAKMILLGCDAYALGFRLIDCKREQRSFKEVPLVDVDEATFGYLKKKRVALSEPGRAFIDALQNILDEKLEHTN